MARLFALILVLSAGPAVAGKAALRPGRAHVLTRSLKQRLPPAVRANHGAVGKIKPPGGPRVRKLVGTGFIVHVDGRRGLVMTNAHVVGDGLRSGTRLVLPGGRVAVAQRVVARSESLDYALIEVALSRHPSVPQVTLAPEETPQGTYIISADGAFEDLVSYGRDALKVTRENEAEARRMTRRGGLRTISVGHVAPPPPERAARMNGMLFLFHVGAPKTSGSPVFSTTSHGVVALLRGGVVENQWAIEGAAATPMSAIVSDLRRKLEAGDIDGHAVGLVHALLRGGRP